MISLNNNSFKYKRAVFIGVDGAGNFFRRANTPCIDRIFANGATSYNVEAVFPTISAECWGSFLTGTTPHVHGRTNNIVCYQEYDINSPFPTVFRRIRQAMPDAHLAAFSHWGPINYGLIEHNIDVHLATDGDFGIANYAAEYVENNAPTFLFIQFDEVDSTGHGYGYGSERYLEQISITDEYIDRIYRAYEKLGPIEETLFIVTADHGGTNLIIDGKISGDHGGITDEERLVFFAAAGKTVKKGTIGEMNIQDAAAIILHAFGLDIPEFDEDGFSAQIPEGVFVDYAPAPRHKMERFVLEHKMVPTPNEENGLFDELGADAVLRFDGTLSDSAGNYSPCAEGDVSFDQDGYHSSCVRVGRKGSVVIPDFQTGLDSFSLSFWFYFDSGFLDGAVPFLGCGDWSVGIIEGFMLYYRQRAGEGYTEVRCPLPREISHGWINVLITVDRERDEITFRFNFEKKRTYPHERPESGFETPTSHLRIGSDGDGNCNHYDFRVDDFVFYRIPLDDDHVAKLKEYYK